MYGEKCGEEARPNGFCYEHRDNCHHVSEERPRFCREKADHLCEANVSPKCDMELCPNHRICGYHEKLAAIRR